MSSFFRGLWENTYGLLVDDGQLAVGAIAALAITWVIAQYASEALRESAGWFLLAMVIVLVIANVYRAGQNARRKLKRD
jgi:chromate transport protein ChrA